VNPADKKRLSESDICDMFISPAIKSAGWDQMTQIRREVTLAPGPVTVRGNVASRNKKKRKFARNWRKLISLFSAARIGPDGLHRKISHKRPTLCPLRDRRDQETVDTGRRNLPNLTESEGRGCCLDESCIWRDSLFGMRGAEMGLPRSGDAASRFAAYVEGLTTVIGHADRAKPLRDYCVGLMMPCARKSVEPMAAITAPERAAAQHQSLLHFVGEGTGLTIRFWPRSVRWCCRR
jgi:hypothetical protein